MRQVKPIFFLLLIATVLGACNRNPLKVDISKSKKEVKFVRFDKELFALPLKDTLTEISELSNKYPDFFNLFTSRIIRIGRVGDKEFPRLLARFLTDTMILNVERIVNKNFTDFEETEKQINRAFKYYQYHFPGKEVPTIFVYTSGFNQSVVTYKNSIGISLDKYLGRNCRYYKKLSTAPQYKITNMHKAKIPSDVAYAWASAQFGEQSRATNLIGNMIYQGKLMYFVDALLPDVNDSLKIGYTTKQLDFCENNEAEMWKYLVERKMLFSTKRMDIIRYINDGPTTSGFPLEAPGRAGIWLGWQIVRQYMKKFPETTLKKLMQNNDYQQILNDSEYFPE